MADAREARAAGRGTRRGGAGACGGGGEARRARRGGVGAAEGAGRCCGGGGGAGADLCGPPVQLRITALSYQWRGGSGGRVAFHRLRTWHRQDQCVIRAVRQHGDQHIDLWRTHTHTHTPFMRTPVDLSLLCGFFITW